MYCGAALPGSRGETPSLPFLCRRFFSQTEKKCRNAGSVKSLIIVGREGSKPIISKSKLLYRLPPIADSRKGCPYERLAIDICRCRGSGASRSPHPTSCISKNLCRFRGRIISYYYFECQRNNPSVSASPSQLPTGEPNRFCDKSKSIKPKKIGTSIHLTETKNDL